jgi:hypothetical protein
VVVRADIDLLRFSIIFGDLLHNLRSALDHAVWLVACRSTPVAGLWATRTAPSIMFPISHKIERRSRGVPSGDLTQQMHGRFSAGSSRTKARSPGRGSIGSTDSATSISTEY